MYKSVTSGLFFSYHHRMIINHQVTTSSEDDREYGFTPEEAADILSQYETEINEHTWETTYLVLVESSTKPYVSEYGREAVLELWRENLAAGIDPSRSIWTDSGTPAPRRSLPCDEFHRSTWVLDGEEATGARGEEWNPCEQQAVTVLAWPEEQRRELGGDLYPGLDGVMAMKVCSDDAARLLKRPGVFEVVVPGEDVMDPYHREEDLRQLRMDPGWTEATKHLDAVAAFVAQGTHNPRAYARAQSRFVGSILKLAQNHMEDTISKAVEDRFALLSHDGIEDTRVLANRFDDIRVAVNEVFQYPDMNDVVGRDMVGL